MRPSSRAVISIAIATIVLSAGAYIFLSTPRQANPSSIPSHFTINGKSFSITYVATNEGEWTAGLVNKKVTDATTMLFILPRFGIYPFWMDTVNSSLDMIWLNVTGSVGRVVYLVTDAPVCSPFIGCPTYTPSAAANYVIEAKGGFAQANGVAVGTTVQFG